ncbi:MAG TPA: 2-C-methyl-D-erythritol 4-phosphate cytidylyltransferase [Thermoanaerobaculia bacterium]|nr:2-C-methyl-D-erythritol 4-phosphate cytidylyltransferase [Thermoanaerobaculia bacterium]
MRVAVIIPAAGTGSRFGGDIPKQFVSLSGKPILQHVLERFIVFDVERIVVAVADQLLSVVNQGSEERVRFVAGGQTRQQSVSRALSSLQEEYDVVAIHDAVRPLLSQRVFDAAVAAAVEHGAALPAVSLSDTIHAVENGLVVRTLDRSELVAAQTPQCFRLELLKKVMEQARTDGADETDEAALFARYGHRVAVVPGDTFNIKITRPEDLMVAEALLAHWSEE